MTEARSVHFIGICGAGMSAVANLMREAGWQVTGSDEAFYPPVSDYVKRLGIPTMEGYRAANIPAGIDRIVIGKNARLVPETNPEVAEAFDRHPNKIRSFPEIVGEMTVGRHNLVVAGSYGKSTVTALIAHVLAQVGHDPGYLIGALPKGFETTSTLGKGPLFVIEGDEYPAANWDDRSKFEHYHADTVVLTAACHDHVNVFPTHADYLAPFERLLGELAEKEGRLVACTSESAAKALADAYTGPKTTYAVEGDADFTGTDLSFGARTRFTLQQNGKSLGTIESGLLGRHNIENVLAAAAALLPGEHVTFAQFAEAISCFEGLTRRLDRKVPDAHPVHVYEGFGSSYEKARAAIDAMRLHFPESRLIVLFEPHTFTWRNRAALNQYRTAFDDTDIVFVHQPAEQGAASHDQVTLDEILTEARAHHSDIRPIGDDEIDAIPSVAQPGDAVLILSSGSFGGHLSAILDRLAAL